MNAASPQPAPLTRAELIPCLEELEAGRPFKETLEQLLLTLPFATAEHFSLLMREGRGAWVPLLRSCGGRALFVGNAFSGTAHVLAALGFRPRLHDASEERLRFEVFRCKALTGVEPEFTLADLGERLPYDDDEFDLVVQEGGAPHEEWGHATSELLRVSRGEVVLTADNRLGYKRSLGARGEFAVLSPTRFLASVVNPPHGERTLAGYRASLACEGQAVPEAYSLYPHSGDFTHVVAIDGDSPKLHIGPKERANKLKIAGKALGLFRWLTPSFAIVSDKRGASARTPRRIERLLAEISERVDEPLGIVDEWIATRGNTIVVQTRAAHGDLADEDGRWSVHIPLSPQQRAQITRHAEVLEHLWTKKLVPAPEPIYSGRIDGIEFCCERRLAGFTAPQYSGDESCMRKLLEDCAEQFTALVQSPPMVIDERRFEKLFAWRYELVASLAGREETAREVLRLRDEVRELVLGKSTPLCLQHADLRNKHVQTHPDGSVIGYLDWGSSRDRDLPYFDLLQLVVHEYKQATGCAMGAAWRLLLEPGRLRDWEYAAFERYRQAVGLDAEVARGIERSFPVFVAAMAESNWDYSRPRWVHHHFGI